MTFDVTARNRPTPESRGQAALAKEQLLRTANAVLPSGHQQSRDPSKEILVKRALPILSLAIAAGAIVFVAIPTASCR